MRTRGGANGGDADPSDDDRLPGRGLTILIVEDSQDVGAILAGALEDEGCITLLARTGTDALALARRARPDLITLDLALPGMSGVEVLAELRRDPDTQAIPIVAVSAHPQLGPELAGEVARVISKPFYLSDVVTAVLQTLGRAQT